MRITENANYATVKDSIFRSREKMQGLQQQSSSLKKLNQPSDDPVGALKVLEMRTEKVNSEQYLNNAKMAEAFLAGTDHAIGDLADVIIRAKEIALNQASAASSSEETRMGVSEEVTQLFNQAVAIGNRRLGDRYILSGFKTQSSPVDPEGRYLGDSGEMMLEIGNNIFITTNVPGEVVFNTHPETLKQNEQGKNEKNSERQLASEGAPSENINLYDELQNFRIALLTGEMTGIRNSLERFDSIHGHLVSNRAKVGSRIAGLQSTTQANERHSLTQATLSSMIEDADMAEVVSELGKEESIFRSSLASAKKLIQPTLLDFLR